jgi:formate--tetrahydrofolate ligase
MEDINLHFTGDFAAIAAAHNLLAAVIDNHIYQGNELGIETVTWRRVIDMNDRSLRDRFDIVVASEVMAVLCLVESLDELRERLGNITVGSTINGKAVTARDLNVHGAMTALLKEAIKPNLVQTLEGNPALIHGGPFANIAHGCNSVIATKLGLKLADYVVTEAGFGSDLGAEKFLDIKCRKSGLQPDAVVIVATLRAVKHHGHGDVDVGFSNLKHHIHNIRDNFGLPCVVAINHFSDDDPEELLRLAVLVGGEGVQAVMSQHWALGGEGATELAEVVLDLIANAENNFKYVYSDDTFLLYKIQAIVEKVYNGEHLLAPLEVQNKLHQWVREGYGHYPICIAKTHASLSTDPTWVGAPAEHSVWIKDVELRTGAEYIVVRLGNIITLPGLPKEPNAVRIDIDPDGDIVGLS